MRDPEDFLREVADGLPFDAAERADILEELRAHVADSTAALEAEGRSPDDARRTAVERLGPPERLAKALTEARRNRRRLLAAAGAGSWAGANQRVLWLACRRSPRGACLARHDVRLPVHRATWCVDLRGELERALRHRLVHRHRRCRLRCGQCDHACRRGPRRLSGGARPTASVRPGRRDPAGCLCGGGMVRTARCRRRRGPIDVAGLVGHRDVAVVARGARIVPLVRGVVPRVCRDDRGHPGRADAHQRRETCDLDEPGAKRRLGPGPDGPAGTRGGHRRRHRAGQHRDPERLGCRRCAYTIDVADVAALAGWTDLRVEAWRATDEGVGSPTPISPTADGPFVVGPAVWSPPGEMPGGDLTWSSSEPWGPNAMTLSGAVQLNRTPGVTAAWVAVTGVAPDGTRYMIAEPEYLSTTFTGSVLDWVTGGSSRRASLSSSPGKATREELDCGSCSRRRQGPAISDQLFRSRGPCSASVTTSSSRRRRASDPTSECRFHVRALPRSRRR